MVDAVTESKIIHKNLMLKLRNIFGKINLLCHSKIFQK